MSVNKQHGQHKFSQVPKAEIQRSSFNRSSNHKTTFWGSTLVPVFIDEVLPGDTFNLRMHNFTRMATPLYPILDDMFLDSHFFFVPNRLLWSHWQAFNGEQANPGDTTDYLIPQITADSGGWEFGSLADQFGIPPEREGAVNALHFRAYNRIWNEWFRDQNLQDTVAQHTDDGATETFADYELLPRGKRHDYFTSCLPWPQKGPAVSLPLGTSAPVVSNASEFETIGAYSVGEGEIRDLQGNVATDFLEFGTTTVGAPGDALFADLTQATAATINALRQAFQIQKLYERDARGGSRYTEILKSHFGVTSPDARLQRSEYLGGGTQQITFNPVAVTRTAGTQVTGELGATATTTGSNHSFTKSFTEHGVIIGLVSVRAALTYQQGLDRMWSRQTRWDYYWPALSHIGEQNVYNREIYYQGDGAAEDALTFGYQERYAEYRYRPSRICGNFRSEDSATLEAWHLAQDFGSLPVLDADFIIDNPPVERILAVQENAPQFLFDGYFELTCTRPMPTYGVPGLVDHF